MPKTLAILLLVAPGTLLRPSQRMQDALRFEIKIATCEGSGPDT